MMSQRKGADSPNPSTTPAEQTGLALPPADAVTALRIVGSSHRELALPPEKLIFNLGSGDHPDIHLRVSSKLVKADPRAKEQVSRVHLVIERKGSQLWIVDRGSTNGTYVNNKRAREHYIAAGQTFRVGDVTLLAMDDQMRLLWPTLRWTLGYTAYGYVDEMLATIVEDKPLLLIGPPACEQRFLAEQVHATSARRGNGFVALTPPLPERDQPGRLAPATKGSLYLDLIDYAKLPKWFVDELFGETYMLRPIVASPDAETAAARFGEANMPRFRVINIPAIRSRRSDVTGILNSLLAELQPRDGSEPGPHGRPKLIEVGDLGADVEQRLKAFDWPDNFDDLRRAAPRLLAYIECNGNLRAAATKLKRAHTSLGEALRRIGVIA